MTTALTFPGKIAGMNGKGGLIRMHWRTKAKLKNMFFYVVKSQTSNAHPGPVKLTLTRYCFRRKLDYDNLVSTGKIVIDAIVLAKVIIDDNQKIIQQQEYLQQTCKKEDQRTVITITDI